MQNITILDPVFYTIFSDLLRKTGCTSRAPIFASNNSLLGIDFGKEYDIAKGMIN